MVFQRRPIIAKSLLDWIDHYNEISDRPNAPNGTSSEFNASRFALTGVDGNRVIAVDTKDTKLGPTGIKPFIRRDFDSIIGYTKDWPVSDNIAFYPYPPPARRLQKKVHMRYNHFMVPDSDGVRKATSLDPGQVPNTLFGTFGLRCSLRIFFPGLFKKRSLGGNEVHRDRLEEFYNHAIRPAATICLPDIVRDWPASYATAEFKDRNHSQGFTNAAFIIPLARGQELATAIREEVLNRPNLSWAQDFVWGVEVRGIKDTSHHEIDAEAHQVEEALLAASSNLRTDLGSCWYIDVGLEYMMQDAALLWSLDQHCAILIHCLGISLTAAEDLVCSYKLLEDPSTHLHSLSGLRCVLDTREGGIHDAVYIQAYTTDKSQTYHPEGSHYGKAITALQAVRSDPPKFCVKLQNLYHEARQLVNVAARVEVRVPYDQALLALRTPSDELWQGLANIRRDAWWIYRGVKIRSATFILHEIATQPKALRAGKQLLTMVLGLVYIINSIHSAPALDNNGRRVARAVLPLSRNPQEEHLLVGEDREQDRDEGVIYAPGGNIFLRPFYSCMESVMGFEYVTPLHDAAFLQAFNCEPKDARAKLWPATGLPQARRDRVPTRKGLSKTRIVPEDPVVDEGLFETFAGVMVVRDATWQELNLNVPPENSGPVPLSKKLAGILDQFASDMFQKMPNPSLRGDKGRTVSSYSPLSGEGREMLKLEDIKITGDFTKLFTCLQWCRATDEEYSTTIVRLFPKPGHQSTGEKRQINRSQYYILWKELLADLEGPTAHAVWHQVYKQVNMLPWLPGTKSDRMWTTDKATTSPRWQFIPKHLADGDNPAPHILLRPKSTNIPFIRDLEEEARISLRQEEEEESESD